MRHDIRWAPEERDAVVIGASYPGLITAGLLAQAGLKTVIVDPLDIVGQPGGAYPYNGYWISYSHRDGVGMRQMLFQGERFNFEAMNRLGVTLELVDHGSPSMVCHLPPNEEISLTSDPDRPLKLTRFLMGLTDEDGAQFLEALAMLAKTPREEAERLIPVTFAEWLPRSGLSPAAQRALLIYCDVVWCIPPPATSVGRFIINHLQIASPSYFISDPARPGNQGLVLPLAERFKALGGEIWLEQKPLEILMEDGRAAGVRVRNANSFVREIRAPVVVFSYVAYKVFDLIDPGLFPQSFIDQAWSTRRWETPLMTANMGLSDLPRRRSDGAPETGKTFHRLMRSPSRAYGGGWRLLSNCQQGSAPPGKHLLAVYYSRGLPFEESMAEIQQTIEFVWNYYSNLDEIVEWREFQWIPEAHSQGWATKTGERISQKSPIPGLYFSGYATETEGVDYDADACGALRATDVILEDRRAR
jgi:phytoene dehydrogenase-like protein